MATYRKLLCKTSQDYKIMGFEVLDQKKLPHKFALIRHDCDFSPERALAMAKIEANLGIRTTYTVLLTGEFYSPFEQKTKTLFREILDLGHDLGLHFDAAWHEIESEKELKKKILWEKQVLTNLLGIKKNQIQMFSFHNTTPFSMSCQNSHYGGLRNAYAGVLQKKVEYTSDSNGFWIHRSWAKLLAQNHPRIQVLLHPDWWTDQERHPGEKICEAIFGRSLKSWISYRELLKRCKRENRMGLVNAPRLLPKLLQNEGERILMTWLAGYKTAACFEVYSKIIRNGKSSNAFYNNKINLKEQNKLTRYQNQKNLWKCTNTTASFESLVLKLSKQKEDT